MKTLRMVLIAMVLITVACDKKESREIGGPGTSPTPVPAPPAPSGGTSPTPPVYTSGATADFNMDLSMYDEYTGRLPNSPSEFKINLDMRDYDTSASGKAYGGTLKISYREIDSSGNPYYKTASFTAGGNYSEARYNKYVSQGGAQWFKAYFEDAMGALILVADNTDEFGRMNGKIFFKNHLCGRNVWDPPCNPDRPRRCWLVSEGPYDCASYKTGRRINDPIESGYRIWEVIMNRTEYPEGYLLLGTFEGLDGNQALK